jgi:predicted PurR-regulated permease PerM
MIVQQGAAFVEALPQQYHHLRQAALESSSRLVRGLAGQLPSDLGVLGHLPVIEKPLVGLSVLWQFVTTVLGPLSLVLAVFLMSVYWSIEGGRTILALVLVVPAESRDSARELVQQIEEKLGAFVLGQSILCGTVGLMSLLAYWWIGLPYALVLAFVAGVLEVVPNIGPILGTVPAVLVGLTLGVETAAWVVGAQVMISLTENNLLVPRVMDRSVGVNPVVTLLAIAALLPVLGVLGGVLAVPLAAILQLLLARFVFAPPSSPKVVEDRGRLGVLMYQTRELLDDLHRQWRELPPDADRSPFDAQEKELERIVTELTDVLSETAGEEVVQ